MDDVFEYSQYLVNCTCEHDDPGPHGWSPVDGCEECDCAGYWEE